MDHAGIFVCFFELHSFCQEGKRLKDSNSCISIKLNAFYSLLWGRIRKVRRRISVNSTWQENSGSFVWRAAVCFVVRKSKPYTGNKEDHSRHTLAGNQLVCTRCRQLLAICLSIWAIVVGFSHLSTSQCIGTAAACNTAQTDHFYQLTLKNIDKVELKFARRMIVLRITINILYECFWTASSRSANTDNSRWEDHGKTDIYMLIV